MFGRKVSVCMEPRDSRRCNEEGWLSSLGFVLYVLSMAFGRVGLGWAAKWGMFIRRFYFESLVGQARSGLVDATII